MARGHVDPRIRPATPRERWLCAQVRARGLRLFLANPEGRAVRLTGPGGLHIVCSCLNDLTNTDLENAHE